MKKHLVIIIAGIVIFAFTISKYQGCGLLERIYKFRAVKARVHAVLQGIQLKSDGSGTVGDEQMALSRWYADLIVISDMQELGKASDAFDNWRKEASIFYINDFTISEVKLEETREAKQEGEKEEKKPPVFIVTGTIDGGTFIMRVPGGDTISWIQTPW
ncbi:MAG: hypothetical protein JSV88_32140 [Candidatus Aminicenantes bacterium]|nr:MAG: hypothetical protein JSV88_32140 [Candidatus Aminicenantes bacterium]